MKAFIPAAGKGQRLYPLTQDCPKPLLPIAGRPMIAYHLEALAQLGCTQVVINVSYKADKIVQALKDGRDFGLEILYSPEDEPLEVGGGIVKALPLLGEEPFILINGDIVTDYPLGGLLALPEGILGHMVLVPNPPAHPGGDYGLEEGYIVQTSEYCYTYSGIALLSPALFSQAPAGRHYFSDLLAPAIAHRQLTGEHYKGFWGDAGTLATYTRINQKVTEKNI